MPQAVASDEGGAGTLPAGMKLANLESLVVAFSAENRCPLFRKMLQAQGLELKEIVL